MLTVVMVVLMVQVVTCSKDASVAWARVGPTGLDLVRAFDGMAAAVLKCVRWRRSGVEFVCCGEKSLVEPFKQQYLIEN